MSSPLFKASLLQSLPILSREREQTATSVVGGVGIGTTDILPSTVYAIKIDNNSFKPLLFKELKQIVRDRSNNFNFILYFHEARCEI